MTTVIPPGFVQISQQFRLAGAVRPFLVVTGHSVQEAKSTQAASDEAQGAWLNVFGPPGDRGNTIAIGVTRALRRRADGSLEAAETPLVTSGTAAPSQYPPPNSAILVRKRTGLAGRQFRGRMYLPSFFLVESDVDSTGTMSTAAQNAVQGWMNTWRSQCTATGLVPVVLHDSPGVPPTVITALQVQALLATQRRRMRR